MVSTEPRVAVVTHWGLKTTETWIGRELEALSGSRGGFVSYRPGPTPIAAEVARGLDFDVTQLPLATIARLRGGLNAPRLAQMLTAHGVSHVHAHFLTCGAEIAPTCASLGLPLTISCHGYDIATTHRPIRRLRQAMKVVRASPDIVLHAVSKLAADRLVGSGWPAARIVTSYLGVDAESCVAARLGARTADVAFVGRLVEKKGPLEVLEAVRLCEKVTGPLNVEVAGDGPLRNRAEALASELASSVTFHGAVPHGEALRVLGRSRCLVLANTETSSGDFESFGLVYAEALFAGAVVVAYRSPAVVEATGEAGVLVEPSPSALAAALGRVLVDDDERAMRAAMGRDRAEKLFDDRDCRRHLNDIVTRAATDG